LVSIARVGIASEETPSSIRNALLKAELAIAVEVRALRCCVSVTITQDFIGFSQTMVHVERSCLVLRMSTWVPLEGKTPVGLGDFVVVSCPREL
jgi:hypothetical protein